ncbi:hypothetical protein [Cryptosporangium phraense]|uniref:Uncharacterized protein n=1 Tax=Cryptosporangium phraense TaxID=2593070 RepID=A0A545AKJ2_9ACTN|nr:hypothetical protein [Cryptosporangium phraense]TQS41819.1 hypothetical protein FL583_27690 [Cryptosporangium phraense]
MAPDDQVPLIAQTSIQAIGRAGHSIRLGVPDTADTSGVTTGVDVVRWRPSEPDSLQKALDSCDSLVLFPSAYADADVMRAVHHAARRTYALILDVEPQVSDTCTAEAEALLRDAGCQASVVRLPIVLDQVLRQAPAIANGGELRLPIDPEVPFAYVTSGDVGEAVAALLSEPPSDHLVRYWTATERLTCAEWADMLSAATGTRISYRPQCRPRFVASLTDAGLSARAADAAWRRWDTADEPPPSEALTVQLGRQPETAAQWAAAHACCFAAAGRAACPHSQVPTAHWF